MKSAPVACYNTSGVSAVTAINSGTPIKCEVPASANAANNIAHHYDFDNLDNTGKQISVDIYATAPTIAPGEDLVWRVKVYWIKKTVGYNTSDNGYLDPLVNADVLTYQSDDFVHIPGITECQPIAVPAPILNFPPMFHEETRLYSGQTAPIRLYLKWNSSYIMHHSNAQDYINVKFPDTFTLVFGGQLTAIWGDMPTSTNVPESWAFAEDCCTLATSGGFHTVTIKAPKGQDLAGNTYYWLNITS